MAIDDECQHSYVCETSQEEDLLRNTTLKYAACLNCEEVRVLDDRYEKTGDFYYKEGTECPVYRLRQGLK